MNRASPSQRTRSSQEAYFALNSLLITLLTDGLQHPHSGLGVCIHHDGCV